MSHSVKAMNSLKGDGTDNLMGSLREPKITVSLNEPPAVLQG